MLVSRVPWGRRPDKVPRLRMGGVVATNGARPRPPDRRRDPRSSTMKTSPFKAMTERFGDKQKLVSALEKLVTDELWLKRVNEEKGLERVSNKKLLHLHDLL